MKKTYITPNTLITRIAVHRHLLANSYRIINEVISEEDDGGWVKSNTTSNSNYNVWEEDWNQ